MTETVIFNLKFFYSSGFWYDSRLRCDVVDLYFKLYGKKRPQSIPIPELALLRQPTQAPVKQEKSKQEKFTIPKAEKRKLPPPDEPEGKPVEFSAAVEAREVAGRALVGEVPGKIKCQFDFT